MVRKIFRRRDAAEHLKGSDSVLRRHLAGQLTSSAGENNEPRRTCGIPATRCRAALLPATVAVREKEVLAQSISLEVLREEDYQRPRLSRTRHSRRAVRKNQKGERRRQGRNHFDDFESRLRENFRSRVCYAPRGARVVAVLVPSTESLGRRLTQARLQQLRDLHRVQCCAFEQLVAGHPKGESVFKGAIKTDPANLTIILPSYTQRHWITVFLRLVDQL